MSMFDNPESMKHLASGIFGADGEDKISILEFAERFSERLREEGRREVYREILAVAAFGYPYYCAEPYGDNCCRFCEEMRHLEHLPTCLWLKATRETAKSGAGPTEVRE